MSWTINRIVALVAGIIFTVVGIAGLFIAPGMAKSSLLGFDIDLVHNLVHLVIGVLGLAAAFTLWSQWYNRVIGIVYLLVGIAGLIYPALYFNGMLLGIMHVNALDHALHLVAGAVLTVVGFELTNLVLRPSTPSPSSS